MDILKEKKLIFALNKF